MFKNSKHQMPNFIELEAEALSEFSTTNSDHNRNNAMTKSLTFSKGKPESPLELTNSLVVPQVQSRKVSFGNGGGFKMTKKNRLDNRMTESAVFQSKNLFNSKSQKNDNQGFSQIFQQGLFGGGKNKKFTTKHQNLFGGDSKKKRLINELNYQFLDTQ